MLTKLLIFFTKDIFYYIDQPIKNCSKLLKLFKNVNIFKYKFVLFVCHHKSHFTLFSTGKEKKNFGSNWNQKNDDLNQKRLVQITNQVGFFGSHLVQI
jgi:hypothetical protein